MKQIPGGVTAPKGFRAWGVHCGVKRGNAFDRFLRLQNYLSVKQFPLRNSGPGGEATFFICRGTALQPLQRGAKLVHPELCICQLPVALCGKALPAWM